MGNLCRWNVCNGIPWIWVYVINRYYSPKRLRRMMSTQMSPKLERPHEMLLLYQQNHSTIRPKKSFKGMRYNPKQRLDCPSHAEIEESHQFLVQIAHGALWDGESSTIVNEADHTKGRLIRRMMLGKKLGSHLQTGQLTSSRLCQLPKVLSKISYP